MRIEIDPLEKHFFFGKTTQAERYDEETGFLIPFKSLQEKR